MHGPSPKRQSTLTDLPNLSFVIAEALRRYGVATPQTLVALGAEGAWQLLRQAGVRVCLQSLLALEGAIRGVSWHALPPARRQELMRFASRELG